MAKNEAATDLWVYDLLKDAEINLEPQGSTIIEINEALKTASKKGTGKIGRPEYVGTVKDFLLVIENKASTSKHIKLDENDQISLSNGDVRDFAVNGALYYAKHLAKNTSYKKIIAFGISGSQKRHKISPIFVDETEYHRPLDNVESFVLFSEQNIDEYYIKEILKEDTDKEKELAEILKDAAKLHEHLRSYGNLKDIDKPIIVSGILLALREGEFYNFSVDSLSGDKVNTDGMKIYEAIKTHLTRTDISPEVKKDKILSQFSIIKDTNILNEVNEYLGKTPLKHYVEFLNKNIYRSIRYLRSSEDYLGRFYGEFMSYSGGDGQTLGIVLTPKHIADLFCDLVDIKPNDVVLDPCAGTAGFLIAAMHAMLSQTDEQAEKNAIKKHSLHGIEMQPYMFTIATTNMILRGDGKSNLINDDFLRHDPYTLQLNQATVGMMNPPYSQGSRANPTLYEISFTEHLLDSLTPGGRCIVIIPQSSVTGKTREEQEIKESILSKHTLEGVVTLNKDTFYGVGTHPCIAVFTAGNTHPENYLSKFIDFRNDGYKVSPHIGLIETEQAKDRKHHLLDVWFDRIEAETAFCVKTTIEADDEWLHSYHYFDDKIPEKSDFERVMNNYLVFELGFVLRGLESWLIPVEKDIKDDDKHSEATYSATYKVQNCISEIEWCEYSLKEIFEEVQRGKRLKKSDHVEGSYPYISSTSRNNGIDGFVGNASKVRFFSNCMTIANSGSVGSSFYHPYEFVASDHVTHLKNSSFTKYIYLFICTLTEKLSSKYNFLREINDKRISREVILLPMAEDGEPDFNFMHQYMLNIEIGKRNSFKSFLLSKERAS